MHWSASTVRLVSLRSRKALSFAISVRRRVSLSMHETSLQQKPNVGTAAQEVSVTLAHASRYLSVPQPLNRQRWTALRRAPRYVCARHAALLHATSHAKSGVNSLYPALLKCTRMRAVRVLQVSSKTRHARLRASNVALASTETNAPRIAQNLLHAPRVIRLATAHFSRKRVKFRAC